MVKEATEFQRMVALYEALDNLGADFCPMPDEVMDIITDAQSKLEHHIVTTNAVTHQDVAAKFHFVARLIGQEAGEFCIEFDAVQSALHDLVAYRNAQSLSITRQPHAQYNRLLR